MNHLNQIGLHSSSEARPLPSLQPEGTCHAVTSVCFLDESRVSVRLLPRPKCVGTHASGEVGPRCRGGRWGGPQFNPRPNHDLPLCRTRPRERGQDLPNNGSIERRKNTTGALSGFALRVPRPTPVVIDPPEDQASPRRTSPLVASALRRRKWARR